jgi:hypothetical protein
MNKSERHPWPMTDEYVRQTLIKKGIDKINITPQMIELQRAKFENSIRGQKED